MRRYSTQEPREHLADQLPECARHHDGHRKPRLKVDPNPDPNRGGLGWIWQHASDNGSSISLSKSKGGIQRTPPLAIPHSGEPVQDRDSLVTRGEIVGEQVEVSLRRRDL
jgi:hypothetical protein